MMPTRVLGTARTAAAFPSLEACAPFGGQQDTGPTNGETVCASGERAPRRPRAPEAPWLALPRTALREVATDALVVETSATRHYAAGRHGFTTRLLPTAHFPSTRWRPPHSSPLPTWRVEPPLVSAPRRRPAIG